MEFTFSNLLFDTFLLYIIDGKLSSYIGELRLDTIFPYEP